MGDGVKADRPAGLFPDLSPARAVEQLTALWALSEAGMGGLIHAIKIPFTGIVVGSLAVILITMIGHVAERKTAAIFRATMVVLLIKAAVSPHTPAPAYLAVAFQGLAGALLFGRLPSFRLASLLLGLLALWEGAAQKLTVMTLIYGRPLWDGVDAVGRWLLGQLHVEPGRLSPTAWFLVLYFGYYTASGLLVGWLAAALPYRVAAALRRATPAVSPDHGSAGGAGLRAAPARWWRRVPFKAGMAALLLCGVLIYLAPAAGSLARGVYALLRAALAIGLWMLVFRPLAQRTVRWFQRREQGRYGHDVARAMDKLPALRDIAAAAWEHSAGVGRWRRGQVFLVELIARTLGGAGAGARAKGDTL